MIMSQRPAARVRDAQIQARLEGKILILGMVLPVLAGDVRSGGGAGSGDPRTTPVDPRTTCDSRTSSGLASRARRMISSLMSRPKDSVGRACTDCEADCSS